VRRQSGICVEVGTKGSDTNVQAMSDSLLQDYKDAVQRRVGGLQRLCKLKVEGDGLAARVVSGAPADMV